MKKQKFLSDVFFSLVVMAALTRSKAAPTYAKAAPKTRKKEFRQGLHRALEDLRLTYMQHVTEEQHISNIEHLAKTMSDQFGDCLSGGRFRVGRAQKALNLYLKYWWCIDKIPCPPHCPFDATIISKLGLKVDWTKLDDINVYRELVALARSAANDQCIAKWELNEYKTRRHSHGLG